MLSEISQTQKGIYCMIPLNQVSRVGKFIWIESGIENLGNYTEEMGSHYLMSTKFLFQVIEKVLEMDSSEGYTTVSTHLTLLNCTWYKWFKGHIISCIFCHTCKKPHRFLGPIPRVSEAREFTFLASSPVMLMLLV